MILKTFNRVKAIVNGLRERLYSWNDYRIYAKKISSFREIAQKITFHNKEALLVVSGRGMNVLLAQIWTVLSLSVRTYGYRGFVLTTHSQKNLNRYFKLLGLQLLWLDDLMQTTNIIVSEEFMRRINELSTFDDFRNLSYKEAPIGQIALSTYSRHHGTGIIDIADPKVRNAVTEWIFLIYRAMHVAELIVEKYNVRYLFFTEVFMEEYGAFYYVALSKNLNITRFAGTVRDDAIIAQHLTKENDRIHHASLSRRSWDKIKQLPVTSRIEAALTQNFVDRYGNKWHRSKRNHPNTQVMTVDEARNTLEIAPGRKVAVVFSHILYDTLFFFGTDLFENYAEWLVETVRIACQNSKLDWLIKVHPSNLWRGELNILLKGTYEEERLIEKAIGRLPSHVRIISADTKINPYTWFQLADYGITVRGTSGLEMAALGKTVITAGTGRYEGNGFTVDPANKTDYLELLKKLPDVAGLTTQQVELAKRYAYAIFLLKPYVLGSMKPRLRTGVKKMTASDDLILCCNKIAKSELPPDLKRFSEWVIDPRNHDLLEEWDSQ